MTIALSAELGNSVDQPDDLTPSQRRAVEHTEGPLLVLAGPGSGKTRVITRRIGRIVEKGVSPSQILAITFTNKAAGEMAERVDRLLPGTRIWVSTFHRFCARVLRQRAEAVGLRSNFSIFDVDDQRRLVREVVKELNYDPVHFPPERLAERISRAKNDLMTAEAFAVARQDRVGDVWDSVLVQVYPEYQRRLIESNAVDFDDLLLHIVQILHDNPEIRRELDERFRYVLVDEYQDTNKAQYEIIAALSRDYPNLCVTGDPDQSIYGWRGARIENILRFEADYRTAAVIRLEENFRSTKSIVEAADRLIAHNVRRKIKTMRTDNPLGVPVELLRFDDGRAEAEGIARSLREALDSGQRRGSDVAIFYRINALSREFEHALAQYRIPYQVASGYAFYDRTEIKDLLAYLRLVANPRDRLALLRVVNVPTRGIGKTSLGRLAAWANSQQISLLDAVVRAQECPGLPSRSLPAFKEFAKLLGELTGAPPTSVKELLELILTRTGYAHAWRESPLPIDQERLANVNELITAAAHYDAGAGGSGSVEGFLETTALVTDVDSVDSAADRVTLMTLHAAKGLEFTVVYIVGVEQNFLPHERAVLTGDPNEYEEERRLLFVGMTRARERLVLTRTRRRDIRGRSLESIRSEFLREIDLSEECVTAFAYPGAGGTPHDEGEEGHSEHPEPESQVVSEDEEGVSLSPASTKQQAASLAAAETNARRLNLMTGAELLAQGGAPEQSLMRGFAVGNSVRHPRYGLGKIVKVTGFGKNRLLTVEFDDDRSETFVAGKSPLQPVGSG